MNHFCYSIIPPRKIVFYGEKQTLSHILLTQAFVLLRGIFFIIRSLDLCILDQQHLNIFTVQRSDLPRTIKLTKGTVYNYLTM